MSDTDERVKLTMEQSLGMLPITVNVHTFRQSAIAVIGADWERDEIIKHIEKFGAELAGEIATGMGHGLVVEDERGFLFVETVKK